MGSDKSPAPDKADGDATERRRSSYKWHRKSKPKNEKGVSIEPKKKKGKKATCRSFFAALCGSKSLVSKYDREEYIRTTLCELAVYALYLTVTCMISYGLATTSSYYYTNIVSHLFLETNFEPISGHTFKTSRTVNDFWGFAETAMLDGLYWKYWYGVEDPGHSIPFDKQAILHENKLIGRARLRQLRVNDEPCPIAEKFSRLFRTCYPSYSVAREETDPFHKILGTKDAWKYHTEDELGGTSYWGHLATYSGAGAYLLLGTEKEETIQLLTELKNNLWINRATRAVFLDFTLHNANVNMFCIVKLVWEFPTTGGVVPSWSIRTVRMNKYNTPYEYFLFALECIFVAFTVYYTLQEVFEMMLRKCGEYWSDIWSYMDISILLLSYLCIGFSIYKQQVIEDKLEVGVFKDPNTYISFFWFGFWESQYNNTVAVLVFLAWIKLFKYISFNKTMTQLSTTMSRCTKDIGGFAIMFFIIFFAFAQLGYLLFGSQVEDFKTFQDTTFSLLRLILGDFNFRAIEAANRILGPAFFVMYVFFVFFVLLNMFLAIINDTYSEVKGEIKVHGAEFEVIDYVKRGLNRLCCGSREVDVEGQVRLANTENVITNMELRENFKKSNFSDVEIEMFLTKYELDEERPIDVDEAENVLGGLEGFHNTDGRGDEVNFEKEAKKPKKEPTLNDQEISELQSRMGVLETALTNVTRRLDHLMERLDIIRDRDAKNEKPNNNPSPF